MHGGLDVLVNNAGISPTGTAEETSWELWDEVMAINLKGTFLGCKKAIPLIRKRGGGAIVNLASINAIRGNNRLVAYAATKGGVLAMTMSLALDHIGENIRVNCVCPATIDTDMVRQASDWPHGAARGSRFDNCISRQLGRLVYDRSCHSGGRGPQYSLTAISG